MKRNKLPVNHEIRARRIILIDTEGNKRGEFLRNDAIDMAKDEGLDLVQVSNGDTPTCKMMDYGKFLYQQKKKAKPGTQSKLKEIKLTPVTDTHDFNVRVERARGFLNKGHRVKVTMVFKGRHRHFRDLGEKKCKEFAEALSDIAQPEGNLQSAGRFIFMTLTKKPE